MRILVDANATHSGHDHVVALVVERDDATVGDLAQALHIAGDALVISGVAHHLDVLLSNASLVEGARIARVDDGGGHSQSASVGIGSAWVGVSGGPSTGAICRLDVEGPSAVTIGRGPQNDLDIDNTSVSAHHGLVDRTAHGVTITDLGSTNGTWIGDTAIAQPAELAHRNAARIGSSRIEFVEVDTSDRPLATSADHADDHGRVLFNRSPRGPVAAPTEPVAVPEALPERKNPTLRIATLVVPIIFAAVMVMVLGSWRFALFALLSPVMALGTWISSRRTVKQERAGDVVSRSDALKTLRSDLERAEQHERFRRRQFAPNLLEVRRRVELPSSRLWERRLDSDDALTLGLGVGSIPWDPVSRDRTGATEYDAEVLELINEQTSLDSIEILADLREGPLGFVGDDDRAKQAARSALLQLATHHGPADVTVVILTNEERLGDWAWAQWLPHLTTADGGVRIFTGEQSHDFAAALLEQVKDGATPTRETILQPAMLIVVDDLDVLHRKSSPVRQLLERTSQNIFGVVIAPVQDRLPASVATVVDIDAQDGEFSRHQPAQPGHVETGIVDGIPLDVANDIARALARFDDPEGDTADAMVPTRVLPQDILPGAFFTADAAAIRQIWQRSKQRHALTASIGVSAGGVFDIDLVSDGPHGLVAGTTGAGKSEFLRTMVLGLAANHDSDDLVFVLVDYKGGSAFDRCASLPHVVGLVTDLDEHLAERALQSLEAELHHRESVLRTSGCSDILEYRDAGSPAGALPRLVVVIDEFATMKNDLPDFVKSLVGIAQTGRSLGVHLILATQRPSGAVDANIRANTNLRVALRVQDTADSSDVIDDPGAARIDRAHPGRALLKRGEGDLVLMQSAYVSDASGRGESALRVGEVGFGGAPPAFASTHVEGETTNLELLVRAITTAAAGCEQPRRPWLEELPEHIDSLAQVESLDRGDDATVLIAVGDDPKHQRRVTRGWNLDDGHLSVIGGPGAGVTTTLRSAIVSLGAPSSNASKQDHPVWVFPVDHGAGGLAGIDEHAHVASVIRSTDQARQDRLLQYLATTLEDRRAQPAARHDQPLIVVAIDGLGSFAEANDIEAGTPNGDIFGRIGRDGPAVGMYLLTGFQAQNEIPRMVRTFFNQTIVLEQADERAYSDFGIRNRSLPAFVPGRALFDTTPMVAQVIDWEAVARNGEVSTTAFIEPPSMEGLSNEISTAELPAAKVEPDLSIPFGLFDRTRESASLELRAGEHGLVAGPSRSGRTNTLRVLASQLRSADPSLILIGVSANPESELFADGCFDAGGPLDGLTNVIESCLAEEKQMVIFVDDAERIDLDRGALFDIARTSPTHATIIAAVRSSTARQGYSHWTRFVRASGKGILLEPDQQLDGELLGIRLPRGQRVDKLPGRGYLVDGGTAEVVQTAISA